MRFPGMLPTHRAILTNRGSVTFHKRGAIYNISGFTLLELMLSLAILGVVMLIIFGALRIGTKAWEKGEKDVAMHQRQRAVLGLLSSQIASACIYNIKMEDDDAFYFKGSEGAMEFVSRTPIVPGTLTGVVYVKYEVGSGVDKGKRQLKFYEKDAGFLKEEDLESQNDEDFLTLIPGVEDLQFEYLKEEEEGTTWQTSWQPPETDGMPLAVKIILKQDEETAPVSLIIPIRCQKG